MSGVFVDTSAIYAFLAPSARVGLPAVQKFEMGVLPLLQVTWIDAPLYSRAMAGLLAAENRQVSLTDWSSFELMRHLGIKTAFTFDAHFSQRGFSLRPKGLNQWSRRGEEDRTG